MKKSTRIAASAAAFSILALSSGSAFGGIGVLEPPAGARIVNFDRINAPTSFGSAQALRTLYSQLGVTFSGPGNDGGAILDVEGATTVIGFSAPNVLAFDPGATLQDGGKPKHPQTIHFHHPVKYVQMNVGSASATNILAQAFDEDGNAVDDHGFAVSTQMQTIVVQGRHITRVEITSSAAVPSILDDLAFVLDTTLIDFDDAAAPTSFASASALRDRYAPLGVTFSAPQNFDGGAILDDGANFTVTGYSPPNYLAFNSLSGLSTGGKPQFPQYLLFAPHVKYVAFKAADSGGSTLKMEVFDSGGQEIGETSATLGIAMQTLSISKPGIATVILTSTGSTTVIDDLEFEIEGTMIDFDELTNVSAGFDETTALRSRYAELGIQFWAPNNDGPAILDENSNFGVSGYSAPNFLAFNSDSQLGNGGTPGLPSYLYFNPPVKRVDMRVGGPSATRIFLTAYDAAEQVIGTNDVFPTDKMQSLPMAAEGISMLQITASGTAGIIDNIAFAPVDPCAHDACYVGEPLNAHCEPCVTLVCFEKAECCNEEWSLECAESLGNVCKYFCPPLCGDANEDREVTASDALKALRTAVGSSTCSLLRCDYNGDNKVLAADALFILKAAVGQPTMPNCPVAID